MAEGDPFQVSNHDQTVGGAFDVQVPYGGHVPVPDLVGEVVLVWVGV